MQDDIPEVASISRSKRAKMNVDGLAKVRAALWHSVRPTLVHWQRPTPWHSLSA